MKKLFAFQMLSIAGLLTGPLWQKLDATAAGGGGEVEPRGVADGDANGDGKSTPEPRRNPDIKYINPEVPNVVPPDYAGRRYEARVPDTLDLAERAALAVHGLTAPTDAANDYEIYWWAEFSSNPPHMKHDFNDTVQTKFQEALPLLRLASGDRRGLEVERRWMEIILQMQGPDGLLYYPAKGRPWSVQNLLPGQVDDIPREHYAPVWCQGRLLGAITSYYKVTGDERWARAGRRLVDGLAGKVVDRGDFAYFPRGLFNAGEVALPEVEMEKINDWTNMGSGWPVLGLVQFYEATAYKPALELAGKVARFIRDHGRLYEPDGTFTGIGMHFHGHTTPVLSMTAYAAAADDREMMEFVKKSFAYARSRMGPLVGFAPEWIHETPQTSETCGVADMVALALKMSLAGIEDHWEDVDRWTRNHLAEGQLQSTEWIAEMIEGRPERKFESPTYTTDRVAERLVGGFGGWLSPNDWQGNPHWSVMQCCTGNATRTIYYVWEHIVDHDDGKLVVNLLLNRASPWADVSSHLPYAGRVDIAVKQPCELTVRIPEWVEAEQVRCQVGDRQRTLAWDGRRATVGKVGGGDDVSLTFPLSEREETVKIQYISYTYTLRGNDVVHVEPRGFNSPLYLRERYRRGETQWKTVERFVADKTVAW